MICTESILVVASALQILDWYKNRVLISECTKNHLIQFKTTSAFHYSSEYFIFILGIDYNRSYLKQLRFFIKS